MTNHKNLAIGLILATFVFLVGCTGKEVANIRESDANSTTESKIEIAVEDATNDDSSILDEDNLPDTDEEELSKEIANPIVLVNQDEIIIDQEDIYVQFKGIENDSSENYHISIYCENKMDVAKYLVLGDLIVNGCYVPLGNGYIELPENSKYLTTANYGCVIDKKDLESYGIKTIDSVVFSLGIRDEYFGENEYFIEKLKYVPGEDETSSELQMDSLRGKLVFKESDVSVYYNGLVELTSYNPDEVLINLLIENNSNDEIYMVVDDVKVNGYVIKVGNGYRAIPANCIALSEPNFLNVINREGIDAYGITTIESIEFKISIKDEFAGKTIHEEIVEFKENMPIN